MDNLAPANLRPEDVPEGFTAAESASGGTGSDNKANERELQREAILEAALTSDALERLKRIKLVKAEKASKVESTIISMAMQGKLPGPISEGKLIEMIERMGAVTGGSGSSGVGAGKINFQRKRNELIDSDDDDNDDDLL
mmetsp:Transcript_11021/g.15893  ORF Transcript_11021/g.15893 Transcript_11021/m.15893 type:complete len:140 (+) Transcript_11021:42-461(+)